MAEVMSHGASSFIASTEYYHVAEGEHEAGDLIVQFNDGVRYLYQGVPRSLYTAFITSSSKGRAFHAMIKPFGGEEV